MTQSKLTPFEQRGRQLIWRGDGETLIVEPWGADSVRVRAAIMSAPIDTDFALLEPAESDAVVTVDGNVATLRNGAITVVMTADAAFAPTLGYPLHRCALAFFNAQGELLFEEVGVGGSLQLQARQSRPLLGGDFSVTAAFVASPDERLVGMGQYQQSILNLKGSTFELAHRNSQVSVPFVLSSVGYGFLWHNPAIGRATFASNRTEWYAESTKQLDYWVTAGDSPGQITAAYAKATGHVPLMPEHGLGLWQSKLRYASQEELLTVAREYRRRGIPLDVIVADFFHWPTLGDYRFDGEFWPDPTAMVNELRDMGTELMVSVWPQVSVESENYAELRSRNLLVRAERGPDIHWRFEGASAFIDVTNPEARDFLWTICERNYGAHGVRMFWLDEAEPEYAVYDFDNYRYHLGTNVQVGNLYPQLFSRAFHDGQAVSGQNPANLVRAAWAGSQRYGALVWSGDIHSTFEALRRQVTAGVHMGVAGIPWFTTDIGGFHDGDVTDPAFHELLVRWFQFAAFCPVMRLHGDRRPGHPVTASDGSRRLASGGDNELWSFGEDVFDMLLPLVFMREKLRPYLRELMLQAHTTGQPVMRGLFHEFPDDPECWRIDDQFLLGADLLIAPVIAAGASQREVYLPEGSEWTDLASGQRFDGGQTVTASAPLAVIPVFARDAAGVRFRSLLPLGPVVH